MFKSDYRVRIQQRNAALRTEEAARAASAVLMRGVRIAFGVALIGSIVFAAVAITVIASSSSSNDDRRGGPAFAFWVDPFDVWYLTDASSRRRRERESKKKGGEDNGVLVFLEDAFRIVFGGPDPNAGMGEARWRAIGERIVARGGVVAAEELRPLLDAPRKDDTVRRLEISARAPKPTLPSSQYLGIHDRGRQHIGVSVHQSPISHLVKDGFFFGFCLRTTRVGVQDEAFMLPVLLRLNGSVQVSEAGEMLYAFPELQRRAARGNSSRNLGGAFRAAVAWVEDKAVGRQAAPAPYLAQQGVPRHAHVMCGTGCTWMRARTNTHDC